MCTVCRGPPSSTIERCQGTETRSETNLCRVVPQEGINPPLKSRHQHHKVHVKVTGHKLGRRSGGLSGLHKAMVLAFVPESPTSLIESRWLAVQFWAGAALAVEFFFTILRFFTNSPTSTYRLNVSLTFAQCHNREF